VLRSLFSFPQQIAFNKPLPKSKIYEHTSPSAKLKTCFIQQVDKIIWSYKLSPETINLPAKNEVNEIQIFTIALKNGELKHEVLQAIDKAIASQIVYQLYFEHKIRYIAAYKRQSEADKDKWIISHYFETDWLAEDAQQITLPVVLNMEALYYALLKHLIPLVERPDEKMDDLINRMEQLQLRQREAKKMEVRLRKEKQFNRKVEINSALKEIKRKIREIEN
jgi:hypothetical protein